MRGETGRESAPEGGATAGADTIADGFDAADDRFDLSGGAFMGLRLAGADALLTHAGGTVRVRGIANDDLAWWNALVEPAAAAEASPPALSDGGQAHHLHLTHGDWAFA